MSLSTFISLQRANANSPIELTDCGIVTEVDWKQLKKAEVPIFVTVGGITIDNKLNEPLNAVWPIVVTFAGKMNLVYFVFPIFVIAL